MKYEWKLITTEEGACIYLYSLTKDNYDAVYATSNDGRTTQREREWKNERISTMIEGYRLVFFIHK